MSEVLGLKNVYFYHLYSSVPTHYTTEILNPFMKIPKILINHLKRFYLFIFRKRGREGERNGEKRQCMVASHMPPTGDQVCDPGMCLDWESNR